MRDREIVRLRERRRETERDEESETDREVRDMIEAKIDAVQVQLDDRDRGQGCGRAAVVLAGRSRSSARTYIEISTCLSFCASIFLTTHPPPSTYH